MQSTRLRIAPAVLAAATIGLILVMRPGPAPLPTERPDIADAEPLLNGLGWLRVTPDRGPDGDLKSIEVQSGSLDGTQSRTRRVALDPPVRFPTVTLANPFANQSSPGVAIYGLYDGTASEIHRVQTLTGEDEVIFRDARIIHHAVLDHSGTFLFMVLLDPLTGEDLGIWKADALQVGSSARFVTSDLASERVGRFVERLYVTPDDNQVFARKCDARMCSALSIEVDLDFVTNLPAMVAGDWAGLSNDEPVYAGECDDECGFDALNLRTGAVNSIKSQTQGVGVVALGGGDEAFLVFESANPDAADQYSVSAMSLRDGSPLEIFAASNRNLALVATDDVATYDVPPDWVLFGPDGSASAAARRTAEPDLPFPSLVRLTDGARLPLSDLGQ